MGEPGAAPVGSSCTPSGAGGGAPRRHTVLGRAVTWVVLLTGLNALLCVLTYEIGFGPRTFLFGPEDRFADAIKYGLSYKPIVGPLLTPERLQKWPSHYRRYFDENPYRTLETVAPGGITNLHAPPLTQVVAMGLGWLCAVLPSPSWVIWLATLLYLPLAASILLASLPVPDRSPRLVALLAVLLVASYPALFMLTRANYFSAIASVGVMAFSLSLHRRGTATLAALAALAVAVNVRPNCAIFALALPLVLGPRASLRPLVRFAFMAAALFGVTMGMAHRLYPPYGPGSFLAGLALYRDAYMLGAAGDAFNSSLLPIVKTAFARLPVSPAGTLLAFDLLALGVLAVILAVAWARRGSAATACFLLAAGGMLSTPVYGDYHLLVFVAPLLLAALAWGEGEGKAPFHLQIVFVASVLLLAGKNWGTWRGLSVQVFLNPAIALSALMLLAARGRARAAVEAPALGVR